MNADQEADIIVNNLKNFYKRYNKTIVLILASFLILCIGTMFYQWLHNRYESKAADTFYTIINSDESDQRNKKINEFVFEYKASPYASLAQLFLISEDLKKGNWQGVDMQVNRLVTKTSSRFIIDQAYLLQSRRFLATQQYEKTIETLNKINNTKQVSVLMIRGLAEEKLGHIEESKNSFLKANELLSKINPDSALKSFIWYQQASMTNHE